MKRNKSKLFVGIILVAAGIGLLVWILLGQEADAPASEQVNVSESANEEATPEETTEEVSEAEVIVFTNDGFNPNELTVAKGSTVTVTNNSDSDVQFSSDDHPTHAKQTEMNLEVLASGESASFTATRTGTFGFHDHINDSKTGTLTVVE